jgi:hypothetical protein
MMGVDKVVFIKTGSLMKKNIQEAAWLIY